METTYEPDRKRKKRRPPPPLSPQYLHDEARRYLDRYSPSARQLKRVIMRRVDKCIRFHGGEREEGVHMVDELVDKLERAGVIDDARFAKAWATSLNGRGIPARGIRARLRQKGVPAEIVEDALQALDETMGQDAELLRACAYARWGLVG
jgi:regulatory protein